MVKRWWRQEDSIYILHNSYWKNILYAPKLTSPLVKRLLMVDEDKNPSTGYIYEAMDRVKKAIV